MLTAILTCVLGLQGVGDRAPAIEREGTIARWDEGLPLGNGLFGVLAWGGDGVVRLSLDRGDLWDTRVPETFREPGWTWANMIALRQAKNHKEHQRLFDVPYDTIPYPTKLPTARVEFSLPGRTTIKRWSLRPGDTWARLEREEKLTGDAVALGSMELVVHEREPLVTIAPLMRDTAVKLVRPAGLDKLGYEPARTGEEGGQQWFVQRTAEGLEYAVVVGVGEGKPPHQGQPYRRTLAAAVKTSAECADPLAEARALVARAVDAYGEGGRLRKPSAATRAAFDSSGVTIPDAEIQRQYDLCKHFYVAGSRPGTPPMPLQGVWTADEGGLPPWKGDYHNDLNTQMTYAGYATAGLFHQGASWVDFNMKLRPRCQRFAREFYGVEGLVVPGVMGIDGAPLGGWGQYSLSPTHTAWIAGNIYWHWRYTMNRQRLERDWYPWCKDAGLALRAIGKVNDDGVFRLPLSTSPEIGDNGYGAWMEPNSNYDLSLVRFLFAACAEMAVELGLKEDEEQWRAALATCEPLHADDTGLMLDSTRKPEASHRHFSHAMAIWPLGTMHVDGSDADRETIERTLQRLESLGTSQWCGYSFAWMSAMAARAGRGDLAGEYLTKYLCFTGPNGFHLNGDQSGTGLSNFTYRPFTLEGNFMAMQAVHEMLLQSWGEVGTPGSGTVRVFPAVPGAWQDVSFRNLCAEGGVRVSAERREGVTRWVEVRAERAATVRLRDPFGGTGSWSMKVGTGGADVTVSLKRGETLRGERRE